ncbi:MAG: Fe-S protein assembly co-chaperone HscB [Terracidiphilus sp.]|jgi:molecular chaperone HscB
MLKVLENAVPVACWSCSVAHNESTLFCPDCSKIQPPSGGDYFSVFGLTPRLNIDLSALEQEFHRLSRRLHPDRFARASENEKEWSLADTALLNDAYRTLKDPLRRTEYLLKLEGAAMGLSAEACSDATLPQNQEKIRNQEQIQHQEKTSRVPADLLEEVFDLNMQLEEMNRSKKMGQEDPELKESLMQAKEKFEGLVDAVDRDLRAQWAIWDAGDAAARHTAQRAPAQRAMVALLDRRRYLSNLVRDVTEILGD